MPRGGKRKGSGPKYKYGEPTKQVPFSLPISKIAEIRKAFKAILKEYEKHSNSI